MTSLPSRRHIPTVLICLALVTATVGVFWQVRNHEFINFDDPMYVTQNTHVKAGLTYEGAIWAFTDFRTTPLWHPLTWLSLMLDSELYGLNPGGFHLTNLFLHVTNTLLLFLILFRMTGARIRSGIVAALFALHPIHVESVAWITERKDVLSLFFWLLSLWAYLRYVEQSVWKRYCVALFFFALGPDVETDGCNSAICPSLAGLLAALSNEK